MTDFNHTADKEKFVHSVFSHIAYRYDFLNTALSFNRDKFWRHYAIQKTQIPKNGLGLDVCCGTGMLSIGLAKAAPNGKIIGLDFCDDMLDVGKKNIEKAGVAEQVELVNGNAMDLPFENDSFDCAVIGFALRNVPDIKQTLSEMRRVVKQGGTVVSLELGKPSMFGFRQIYWLYFEQILPLLGKIGVGKDAPYRWLPESLKRYPHQKVITEYFAEIGLKNVECRELTGGIVAVHSGQK